jgi:hypothetical protein
MTKEPLRRRTTLPKTNKAKLEKPKLVELQTLLKSMILAVTESKKIMTIKLTRTRIKAIIKLLK